VARILMSSAHPLQSHFVRLSPVLEKLLSTGANGEMVAGSPILEPKMSAADTNRRVAIVTGGSRGIGRDEQWEFDGEGYMRRREASINDLPIEGTHRRIFGPRPDSERGAPLPLA
jgi:hypothetical protein